MKKFYIICSAIGILAGCQSTPPAESVEVEPEAPIDQVAPAQVGNSSAPVSTSVATVAANTATTSTVDTVTTAAELVDDVSSAPLVEAVAPQVLSTREPLGLVISGKNLAQVDVFLRNEQGELRLEVYDQTDNTITVPDSMYPEDKAGVYSLVIRTKDGNEFVSPFQVTITDEK